MYFYYYFYLDIIEYQNWIEIIQNISKLNWIKKNDGEELKNKNKKYILKNP